jgi:hypothetical protein
MSRTDEQYFADIREAIRDFYRPGDRLWLVRYYRESRKCQMCGNFVDITNCYDLRNTRSNQVIVCGERCIARYAEVIAKMGQVPAIVFPPEHGDRAQVVNRRRRNTVTVEAELTCEPQETGENWSLDDLMGQREGADDPDADEALADGLDPDEMDWDSHDYE